MAAYNSKALLAFKPTTTNILLKNSTIITPKFFPNLVSHTRIPRNYSIKSSSSSSSSSSSTLDPPDVARLAQTARITLTPQEVEEFGPKIQKVVDWFGQLQGVDLESIEPAIRSDIDGDNLRGDVPINFDNREAIIAAIPSYDEPFIKVPQVLNKE